MITNLRINEVAESYARVIRDPLTRQEICNAFKSGARWALHEQRKSPAND